MDSGKLRRVPNQPQTPNRSMRIPTELWDDSKIVARETGYEGVSEMVREDLEKRRQAYIDKHGEITDAERHS